MSFTKKMSLMYKAEDILHDTMRCVSNHFHRKKHRNEFALKTQTYCGIRQHENVMDTFCFSQLDLH